MLGLLLALVGVLLFTRSREEFRQLNTRFSFRKTDKIPYGAYVAYNQLPALFPKAEIKVERNAPGLWKNLDENGKNQVLLAVTPQVSIDRAEVMALLRFAGNGNSVFLSTTELPSSLREAIGADIYGVSFDIFRQFVMDKPDSLTVSLAIDSGKAPQNFIYPGHSVDMQFERVDESRALVLGYAKNGRPNFIMLRVGQGQLFLHLAPMAFTNYFILHGPNMAYYEKALSLLPAGASVVAWDEYFIGHRNRESNPNKPNWLTALMNLKNSEGKKPFGAAMWVLAGLLLLYVLNEMRRKQRPVPVVKKPANDSLDFVKTIGRLYHDKGDHLNLARKMAAYFLEHVRNRYKLPTNKLDQQFCDTLHYKSGIDLGLILSITSSIEVLDQRTSLGAKELAAFHSSLEKFYNY